MGLNIIGCDPGLSGAFALLIDSHVTEVIDMPVTLIETGVQRVKFSGDDGVSMDRATRNILRASDVYKTMERMVSYGPARMFLEQVGGRPGQQGMFGFGRGVGLVEMAAHALKVPVIQVSPSRWQVAMGVRGGKDVARDRATEMAPHMANAFKRKGDHGRAEAVLIGMFGVRQMAGAVKKPVAA